MRAQEYNLLRCYIDLYFSQNKFLVGPIYVFVEIIESLILISQEEKAPTSRQVPQLVRGSLEDNRYPLLKSAM